MASCNSGRVRSAMPCRPSSSGGATLRRAMSGRCACTPRAPPRRPIPPLSCPGCRPQAKRNSPPLCLTAPMMPGAEYLDADTLLALWDEMGAAFAASLAGSGADLQTFLKNLNPAWNLVGRVHFNLAENRRDPEQPFAFMATYTTRLSAQAKAQHVPLGQALREYAGAANRDALLSLLVPVQRAAERCGWLKDNGRCRGDFSSPALVPGRGRATAVQRTRPGKRRCGGAHACLMARQPSGAPTGHGDGWRPTAFGHRSRRIARFPHGRDARRANRSATRKSPGCSPAPTRWCCCAVNGSRSIAAVLNARCGSSRTRRLWLNVTA